MHFAPVTSAWAALIAGIITSLHCAGMCGPLSCLFSRPGSETDAVIARTAYHFARIGAYSLLGAVVGGLGGVPVNLLGGVASVIVPWMLVALFLALAFQLDRRLRKPALLGRLTIRIPGVLRKRGPVGAAFILGAVTPLLPCGPLYFVLGTSAFAGSAAQGAEWLMIFGLGTLPGLWVAQANAAWIRARLGPVGVARVQTGLALVTVAVLVWRLRGTLGFAGPALDAFVCF